jgi:hypothetical protein
MFVFYNLYDLVLLHRLQVIQRITETGAKIFVPAIWAADHSAPFWSRITEMSDRGLIKIKDSDDCLFDFIAINEPANPLAGKPLLALVHFCKRENAVLIVNEDEVLIQEICRKLDLKTCSMDEFNKATINNIEYFEFMAEIKREQIIR